MQRSVWALRAQFLVAGALFATWGVQLPAIKAQYALDDRSLAFALLAAGVGSVFALLQAGRVLTRHAPRKVVPLVGVIAAAAIASMLLPSHYPVLLGLMLAYGVAGALFDVAINDEATVIERMTGRPLMSGFHGMFSLGGMVGAAVWSAMASVGMAPGMHLAIACTALAVVVLAAGRWMLRLVREAGDDRAPLSLPRGPLLLLGVLAGLGLVAEGAMYDWSVLYMREEVGTPDAIASLGYASFSAAMAAGRFGGDWVRMRVQAPTLLRASGLLGAAGMALALLVQHPAGVLAGFALVGLGFANIVPVLFSAAGRVPGVPAAQGIAAVASVGYFGMMAGPPLIGFIAQARSLGAGLLVVIVFALVVTGLARRALAARA